MQSQKELVILYSVFNCLNMSEHLSRYLVNSVFLCGPYGIDETARLHSDITVFLQCVCT